MLEKKISKCGKKATEIFNAVVEDILDKGEEYIEQLLKDEDQQKTIKDDLFVQIETESLMKDQLSLEEMQSIANKMMKYKISRKYIRIVIIGPTQVGKTSSIEKCIKIKLKKNTDNCSSDTETIEVHTFKVDDVTFEFVDTPGLFDTEGRDSENAKKFIEYVSNNRIDIFIWVSRISDVIDASISSLISSFIKKFGDNFTNKLIVMLTYANTILPGEYMSRHITKLEEQRLGNDSLSDKEDDLMELAQKNAWIEFTKNKKQMWRKHFKFDVQVILIENNKYKMKKTKTRKGDYLFPDGTFMFEAFYTAIISTVDVRNAPAIFTILNSDEPLLPQDQLEKQIEDSKNELKQQKEELKTQKRKLDKQKEENKSLKVAVNKAMNDKQKPKQEPSGWLCTIL